MITDMQKRRYTLKKRATRLEKTRRRIVEATMALHEELGPRQATISAIAERAGVQRLTVYRHFPDDTTLFEACTSCWLERNPPPDPGAWPDIAEPGALVEHVLAALYAYYRQTSRMWERSYRDVGEVPALVEPMHEFEVYLEQVADGLLNHWPQRRLAANSLAATMRHLVQFSTWRSLAEQGLDDNAMAELARRWVGAAADSAGGGVPQK